MSFTKYATIMSCWALFLLICFGCAPKRVNHDTNVQTEYELTHKVTRAFLCVYFAEAGLSGDQEEFECISKEHAQAISELVENSNSQYQLLGYSHGLLMSYYWEVVNLNEQDFSCITDKYATRLTKKILQDSWTSDR
jgi:hypothetical protein